MSDFTATIRASLDLSNIDAQLKAIETKTLTLRSIKIDTAGIASQIQQALNSTDIKINLGGNGKSNIGNAVAKQVEQQGQAATKAAGSYNELLKIAQRISKTEIKIKGLGDNGSVSQISMLREQLDDLWKDYNNVQKAMGQPLTTGQSSNIDAVFTNMANKLRELDAKYEDTRSKLASNIQFKIDTGQITDAVQAVNAQFKQLEEAPPHVAANIDKLNSAFNTLNSGANMDAKIRAFEEYERILPVVSQQLNRLAKAEADVTQKNAQILSNNIDAWMNKNSAAADKFGNELEELKIRLQNVKSPAQLKQIQTDFKLIQSQAKASGLVFSEFGQKISGSIKQLLGISTGVMAIRKVIQIGKKMLEEVKAVDSAMVELKKVTDEAASAYDSFQKRVGKNAQKIGTTMSDLINSTAGFARLGYSLNEAEGLAQVANVYSVVGDEIDGIDEATKSLISTMQAFKGEMTSSMSNTDFATNIIDKFNEVGKHCCPAA